MVVGQHRDTVIFLRIQAADPRQPVANADLKPGLVQTVFQFDNRVAQIIRQRAKRRAAAAGRYTPAYLSR
jgi:hypothetical protein